MTKQLLVFLLPALLMCIVFVIQDMVTDMEMHKMRQMTCHQVTGRPTGFNDGGLSCRCAHDAAANMWRCEGDAIAFKHAKIIRPFSVTTDFCDPEGSAVVQLQRTSAPDEVQISGPRGHHLYMAVGEHTMSLSTLGGLRTVGEQPSMGIMELLSNGGISFGQFDGTENVGHEGRPVNAIVYDTVGSSVYIGDRNSTHLLNLNADSATLLASDVRVTCPGAGDDEQRPPPPDCKAQAIHSFWISAHGFGLTEKECKSRSLPAVIDLDVITDPEVKQVFAERRVREVTVGWWQEVALALCACVIAVAFIGDVPFIVILTAVQMASMVFPGVVPDFSTLMRR